MTREEINKIHPILWHNGFKQMKVYNPSNGAGEIRVHSNKIVVDPNVEEIKKLIGNNYSVTVDTHSEIITIK